MMQMLRKAAVAVLFTILIVAFAISMGGNNYFDRYTHPSVAKVGSIEITPDKYERAFQRTLENLSSRARQRISQAQARALGLPQQVLQGLIQEAALDYEAQKLGLGLSKQGLSETIKGNQAFQDAAGNFDRRKYENFLQRVGYNELFFEQEFRSDIIRRQIQGLFLTSGIVPKTMLDAYNRYLNEQRTIAYFTLPASAAGAVEAPSEEALKSFYEDHKMQFMAPEFRKVAVLAVTPQTVAAKIIIPDEEVKALYDSKPGNYAVPERRTVEIIPFKSKEAAEAAATQLKDGKSFADVAKAAGFQNGDINLGSVSKKELGEKFSANDAILDAAFSLNKGKFSQPIDGPLSWVIVRVDGIVPGRQESFDAVKAGIRESIVKTKSAEESSKLVKSLEEERAAGLSLQDIAKKLNLPLEEVMLDRKGASLDGTPAQLASVPAGTVADAAFKSDPGVENEALRLQGGGYAWYDVEDVVKARQKPFDEVKANVEADWRKDQIRTKLTAKARELVERLNHGEKIADVAKSVGAEVKTSQPIKRDGNAEGLPQAAIAQAFSLTADGASSALGGDGESRAVFKVEKVAAPGPLTEMASKALEQRLSQQIAEDNFTQYLTGVEKSAGVTIDQKSFAAVASGGGGGYDGGE
jgi:peptidyl-prolyl cis-trans isomerase D